MTADFELEPGACGASPPNKGRDEKMAVEADCVQSKRVISSDRGRGGGCATGMNTLTTTTDKKDAGGR